MSWFPLALLGYFLLAVVFILDKLIVDKSGSSPAVYAFYSTIFLAAVLLLYPFGAGLLIGLDWVWAFVSALAFGFGLWTLFIAVDKGEATHIDPFNGACITIFIYMLAFVFLGERLTALQLTGMGTLFVASVILAFEKSAKQSGFHVGFVWAIFAGLLFAISHVSAKYLYDTYGFLTGLVWSKSPIALVAIFTLFHPSVRQLWRKKKRGAPKQYARRYRGAIILSAKILSLISNVLIQYAVALGSVTLVGALSGAQFVIMFVMVYLLTKFLPKVFKEYFTKRELAVQTVAIVLVAVGSAFFVM